MGHTRTNEQQEIITTLHRGDDLVVQAYAGTGKTSTIVDAGKDGRSGLYLAFSRDAMLDAQRRMQSNVESKTFHSLAYRMENVGRVYGEVATNIRLPAPKLASILKLDVNNEELPGVVAAVKMTLRRFMQSDARQIKPYHVPFIALSKLDGAKAEERKELLVGGATRLWGMMIDPKFRAIGILHDAYLKLWQLHGARLPFIPEVVFLDEAQDLNEVNIAIVQAWMQKAQIVVVGDDNQSIFMWRGAQNALRKMLIEKMLRLTQSFRFGPEVADVGTQIIRCLRKESIPPLVGNPDRETHVVWDGRSEGPHTILCRTNMGLMEETLECVAGGQSVCVVGKLDEAINLLESAFYLSQGDMDRVKHPDILMAGDWEGLEEASKDDNELALAVRRVKEYGGRIPGIIRQLKLGVCTDERDAEVIVSTAHKAKGREWDVVRLACDFKEPFRFDKKSNKWEACEEERNLLYVAATRARKELYVNQSVMSTIAMTKASYA